MAVTEIAEEHKKVLWNYGGSSDEIFRRGWRYVVGIATRQVTTCERCRNGWLKSVPTSREFVFCMQAEKPALKIVAQDGSPLPAEHLISSVNLRVEATGTEVGDTFRLLAMRKLEDLPLL